MEKSERILLNLPFAVDWVKFKDEVVFAMVNYEATEKAGKPMIDLSYCATQGLHGNVLKTVQFDKKKFSKCHLSDCWNSK